MKRKLTWVLVADGGKARIFECLGIGKGVRQMPGYEETLALPANRDLLDDRPGRGFESFSPMRHSYEAGDPHRSMKQDFARHLADELAVLRDAGSFDYLVLVAPPEFLGNLRSALGAGLASAIVGDLAKDLTHVPTSDIAAHFQGLAPV